MKKIMIVEDSNLMISIIRNFVKKKLGPDVEFVEAHNGKEAVEKYPFEKPDLVFMDIKMPEMDGLSALRMIHSIDPQAKVVMVTSLKEESQERMAKDLGAKLYIMKPFSSADIFKALDI